MGDRTATLTFIAKDAASKTIRGIDDAVGKLGGAAKTSALHIGGAALAIGKLGLIAGGAAVAGITALFGVITAKAIPAASDLNENLNKVNVVFGESSKAIEDFAKGAVQNLGMSKSAALGAAGTFGNLFTAMKISRPVAADMSTGLLTLAADLASFNNMNPDEVLLKLRAGLVGETEPLRTLGVNLNDAALRQKAFDMGLVTTTKEVLPAAAKAQAAYALIFEQTTAAQGDFARTSDGLANQQRIAAAQMEDSLARLGAVFLPIVTQVIPKFTAGIAGAAEVALSFAEYLGVVASDGDTMNDFLMDIPESLRPVVQGFGEFFLVLQRDVVPMFQAMLPQIIETGKQFLGLAGSIIREALPAAVEIAKKFYAFVEVIVTKVIPVILDLVKRVWEGGLNKAVEAGTKVIGAVIDILTDLATWITSDKTLMGILKFAADAIGTSFGIVADVVEAVLGFVGTLGDEIRNNEAIMWTLARIGDAITAAFKVVAGVIDGVIGAIRNAINLARDLANLVTGTTPPTTTRTGGPVATSGVNPGVKKPARAAGGPVLPGRDYLVGEEGAEIIRMGSVGGMVIPNHALGGGTAPVVIQLQVDGRTLAEIVDERLGYRYTQAARTSGAV